VVSSAIFNIGREGEHFEKIELPDVYAPVTDTLPEADSLQVALEKFFNENFNIDGHDNATEQ
jgi:hypothetical protein